MRENYYQKYYARKSAKAGKLNFKDHLIKMCSTKDQMKRSLFRVSRYMQGRRERRTVPPSPFPGTIFHLKSENIKLFTCE